MEATTRVDPLRLPQDLTPQERRWWHETTAKVTSAKKEGERLHWDAIRDQVLAQHARTDYGRLQLEYRARHWRKPAWLSDYLFKGTAVAQDCIAEDVWRSRQASEKFAGANAAYARTSELMRELTMFLERRTVQTLARLPVPNQREGAS